MTARATHIRLVNKSRHNDCVVDLVRGGKLAYLWIGTAGEEHHLTTIAGRAVLRRLAYAILKEVPTR